jgi:hypothetical protein
MVSITTTEQERAAYMAGDVTTARLLARIDALQRALAQTVVTLEAIAEGGLNGSMSAHQCAYAAQEGVDQCGQ